jgi:hypothetical protein
MPSYRIRYVCDASLQFQKDFSFESKGKSVLFLFSKRGEENTTRVCIDVEAADYREADVGAQAVLQPVLDALSFSTGTPLLARHWDLILKGEAGSRVRRAVWCEFRKEPTPHRLTQRAIEETQKILAQAEESLELCWHRYALQRNLILDRFVFQWLAFEALSGKIPIPTICPRCREEVAHCETPLLHEGSNANRAWELFSPIEPECSHAQFKRDIWGKARNSVFHGTAYPTPQFLGQLNSLSPKLRRACDVEFNKRYELRDQAHPIQNIEANIYRFKMFEWETAQPKDEFSEDFPWEAVNKEFGNMMPGEVRMAFPDKWPFKDIDFNFFAQAPGW